MRKSTLLIFLYFILLSCESGDSIPTPTDKFADLEASKALFDSQANFAEDQNYFDESTKVFEGSGGIKIDSTIIYFDYIECFRDSVKYTFDDGVKSTMAYRIRGQKPDYEVLSITIMDEPLSGYYGYNFVVYSQLSGSYYKSQNGEDINVGFRSPEYEFTVDENLILKFDNIVGYPPWDDINYNISCFIECR